MSDHRSLLIDNLQSLPLLEGRYSNIVCINYDPLKPENRIGFFSLVFKATDNLSGKTVAIKFFDPNPDTSMLTYRSDAFNREPEILKTLLGRNRCLQLIADLKSYKINIALEKKTTLEMQYKYFITEWIDGSIDNYFDKYDDFDSITKLKLFNDICLSVEALHRYEVFHRDLKPNNLRSYIDSLKRIVIAIDMGTAAKLSSPHLQEDYMRQVGWIHYSAPEATCGFAGIRSIAPYTDYYALGCMLYELFNYNHFYIDLINKTPYQQICTTICLEMSKAKSHKERLTIWHKETERYRHSFSIPTFSNPGCCAPKGIIDMLDRSLLLLTDFNYLRRAKNLEEVRKINNICLKILNNEKAIQQHVAQRKAIWDNKIREVTEKDTVIETMNRRIVK